MPKMKNILALVLLISLKGLSQNNPFFVSNQVIEIPVVFHVMHFETNYYVTDSLIDVQMDILNQHFSANNPDWQNVSSAYDSLIGNPNIRFVLAQKTKGNNSFNGINRPIIEIDTFSTQKIITSERLGGVDAWNVDEYLNIWLCAMDSSLIGWGSHKDDDNVYEGVIMNDLYLANTSRSPEGYHQGKTLTYLIGQYFGLRRIDKGATCDGNSYPACALEGDEICDTPPMNSFKGGLPNDSISFLNTCIEENDLPDMHDNYMSLAYDSLKSFFTLAQVNVIRNELLTEKISLIKSSKGDSLKNLDIIPVGVQNFEAHGCFSNISFDLIVKNESRTVISNFKVNYELSNGFEKKELINLNIDTFSSQSVTLNIANLTSGINIIKLWLSHPNGSEDLYPFNDTINLTYYFNNQVDYIEMPLSINFESELNDINTVVSNIDDDFGWYVRKNLIGSREQITSAASIYYYGYNAEGQHDKLQLRNTRISGDHPKLVFNYAYAKHSSNNYEQLKVLASSDCGATELVLFNKEGSHLETVDFSVSDQSWEPSSSDDWKEVIIDLTSLANKLTGITFQVTNGYGNNIYLDNVRLIDTNIIENSIAELGNELEIYPNPSDGNIELTVEGNKNIISVLDINGRVVLNESFVNNSGSIKLSLTSLIAGVYFIKLENDHGVKLNKLIKY